MPPVRPPLLDLALLSDSKGFGDLDAKFAHRAFKLGVTKK